MLRKTKGQATLEYAVIIGVIVAALAAMQIYIKRGFQARTHDGMLFLKSEVASTDIGGAAGTGNDQYEPYYISSDYNSTQSRSHNDAVSTRGGVVRTSNNDMRTRNAGGFDQYGTSGSVTVTQE